MKSEEADEIHPRLLLHDFVPQRLCKELEFIHRSCCCVGYRPSVLSTTLAHLIATGCKHLIIPFVAIREKLREKVEERFGCEFQLFVEFTGLVSWCKGASIGWHSDDNRPYLKQRDFAAVCYLNTCGKDFRGGTFNFKDGFPASVVPHAGDTLIYTADSRNVHSVDEVIEGERLTLTLWFTRDKSHDEDAKLISLLSERMLQNGIVNPSPSLPSPAPNEMYWFTHEGKNFDIRCAKLQGLGCTIWPLMEKESSDDPLQRLIGPLRLGKGDEVFDTEFFNVLHALQIVQFYLWKVPIVEERGQEERSTTLNDNWRKSFDMEGLRLAMLSWEDYVKGLDEVLRRSFPQWKACQVIFNVSESLN